MKELHLLLLYADRSDNLDDSSLRQCFLTAMFPDDNRDNILSTIENVVPVVSVVVK